MAFWRGKAPGGREIGLLLAVMIGAAMLRMAWPGLIEFKRDEALLLARALDVAEGSEFHLRGISSSVGFPNTALSVWLYAVPLLFWKDVYAATLFTGLINLGAILGGWWLVRRYWGGTAALAATIMFAISPWAIFHSQKIWAQNLLAPLIVAWAISASLTFVERRRAFILLHFIFLAIAVQVHFAAIALVPATILFLIVFRRRVDWRMALLGCLLALLTAAPFLVYLFSQVDVGIGSFTSQNLGHEVSLKAWRFMWLLTTGREIHALAGPVAFEEFLASVPDLTVVHLLLTALVLTGAIWLARQTWHYRGKGDQPSEAGFILLVWMFLPPLIFSIPLLPVELHYLIPSYPTQFMIAGIALAWITKQLGRWQPIAWVIFSIVTILQVWVWISLFTFITSQSTPGGYGTPLKYFRQAVEQARDMETEVNGQQIIIAGGGENPQEEPFAAIFDVLLRGSDLRFVNVNQSAVFPAGETIVILGPETETAAANTYRQVASQLNAIQLRHDEGEIHLLSLPAEGGPDPEILLPNSHLFANWVNLYGYDNLMNPTDQTTNWRIYWQTGANPDLTDYHFFNHLFDTEDTLLTQSDGPLFSPWQWRAGDRVISFYTLPWSDEDRTISHVRTGIYTYPEFEHVPVLDVAGNPASDGVDLPLP